MRKDKWQISVSHAEWFSLSAITKAFLFFTFKLIFFNDTPLRFSFFRLLCRHWFLQSSGFPGRIPRALNQSSISSQASRGWSWFNSPDSSVHWVSSCSSLSLRGETDSNFNYWEFIDGVVQCFLLLEMKISSLNQLFGYPQFYCSRQHIVPSPTSWPIFFIGKPSIYSQPFLQQPNIWKRNRIIRIPFFSGSEWK